MHKRGLSDIVTTVLIVLIAIAALVLVGAFIASFIKDSGKNISLNDFSNSFEIPFNSIILTDSEITFAIKRISGEEDVIGIILTLEDSTGKVVPVRKDDQFELFESRTYTVNYSALGLRNIVYISVAPVYAEGIVGSVEGRTMVKEGSMKQEQQAQCKMPPAIPGGLIAYYKFDNDASKGENSEFIYDWSGNGKSGIIQGASFDSTRGFDGAYRFDGIGDYVNISGFKGTLLSRAFSISIWFNDESSQDYGSQLITRLGNNGWIIGMQEGKFGIRNGDGTKIVSSASTLSNGWHNGVVTIESGTSAKISIYVDGVLSGSAFTTAPFDSVSEALIGYGSICAGQNCEGWKGLIDEVMIYNRILNDSEVSSIYGND